MRTLPGFSLRVNNATVTVESMPKARDAAPSSEEDLLHGSNKLIAGTSIVSVECRAVVFVTRMHTDAFLIYYVKST